MMDEKEVLQFQKIFHAAEAKALFLRRPMGDLDEIETLQKTAHDQEMQTKARRVRLERALAEAELEARALPAMQARYEKLQATLDRATVKEAQLQADHAMAMRAVDASAYHRSEVALLHPLTEYPATPSVYFIVESGADFAKIGWTASSPAGRRDSLQTGCARALSIVALLPGGRESEQSIHRFFALERTKGEWFRVSERLAALILEIRHGHDISWFTSRLVMK